MRCLYHGFLHYLKISVSFKRLSSLEDLLRTRHECSASMKIHRAPDLSCYTFRHDRSPYVALNLLQSLCDSRQFLNRLGVVRRCTSSEQDILHGALLYCSVTTEGDGSLGKVYRDCTRPTKRFSKQERQRAVAEMLFMMPIRLEDYSLGLQAPSR